MKHLSLSIISILTLLALSLGISFAHADVKEKESEEQSIASHTSTSTAASTELKQINADWQCEYCPKTKTFSGNVQVNFGYLSDDAYHFGHYSGIESNNNLFLSTKVNYLTEEGNYAKLSVDNAGLDALKLTTKLGYYGHYQFAFAYQEIPLRQNPALLTPFQQQNNTLLLPDSWQYLDQRTSTLETTTWRQFNSGVDWQKLTLSWRYFTDQHLDYAINYQKLKKSGIEQFSAAQILNASYLPLAIDEQTEQIDAQLSYQFNDLNINLSYFLSRFSNEYQSIHYENPFSSYVAGAEMAEIAHDPDNHAYKIRLKVNYQLLPASSLKLYAAFGQMRQNNSLLPYSSNAFLQQSLPSNNFDAKVATTDYALRFYSRWSSRLSFRAKYQFNQRDNQSEQFIFTPVFSETYLSEPLQNTLYDTKKQQLSLATFWRFLPSQQASIEFSQSSKTEQGISKHKTDNQGVTGSLLLQSETGAQLTIRASHFNRDAQLPMRLSTQLSDENPLLQRYNLAARVQNKLSMQLSKALNEQLYASISGALSKQNYQASSLGLQNNHRYHYGADLSWQVDEKTTLSTYFQIEDIRSQAKASDNGSLWRNDTKERVDSFGLTLDIKEWLDEKFALSLQAIISDGSSATTLSSPSQDKLPEINSVWQQFNLKFSYQINPQIQAQLQYQHQRLENDDFAIDYVDVNTVDNLLTFGAVSHHYQVNYFILGLTYQF
ncbi:MtrB/PioB family decaheme-associated outer membrane protein [Colwellia sp. BRX10-3]|uniref:MtrB/PioB family decaheme-associated outer membrane protein n=1 Tax=Colwellia sp. BRX10-3 TaxID=2759844 RepID=UPI0015F5E361|nr:MtrB/PioB family decaheme-associated outer membrane protein [Colwellia sp. BRX10-3]MBA6390300.1 MtrB/PioB family decaheme-associated outer membrane protein [Colwellia sp. BRX10-3]